MQNLSFSFQVDEIAIPYLGYLPQELEGSDTFNFYHPGDLVYLKEAYENIVSDQGKPFKSRAYRFKAKNGCYLTLETVWSCFINPWSKKLEFVDAKHTIIKGPTNKDIFAEPGENALAIDNGTGMRKFYFKISPLPRWHSHGTQKSDVFQLQCWCS